MFSKVFTFAAVVASAVVCMGIPTREGALSRQFVFAAATDNPTAVNAPAEPPAEVATETSDMGMAMSGLAEEDPVASVEPMGEEGISSPTSSMTGDVPEIAYNIGADAFGKFEADPVEYIVGETSAFEIPEAVIGGAEAQNIDLYKSHRFGLLGSTWGYDIPVPTPGMYTCTLHYAETYSEFFTDEPNRTFNIELVGDGALDASQEVVGLDIMVELGGAEFTAYTQTFDPIAVEKTLTIRETPTKGDAFLSGISCLFVSALA